ncbi:hypothetical protein QJS10_CPA02g00385 [Acorus calamus]|uniref:Stress enhanced protein 1 n=1 Tax=Acorus calamus TaxID=4465 RepID=A0AAV9FG59_ACOCL|nr:hypothetical protein QJS10_CPA02g00385 [Acorus calamus]
MAYAQFSTSLCNLTAVAHRPFLVPSSSLSRISRITSPFVRGSPLLTKRTYNQRKHEHKSSSISIRCEQSTKEGGGLDVWLGRFAMVGFAIAITIEVATGRGLLENIGLVTPLPTLALAVTGLVGVLTAFFIFQSASRD